MDRILRKVEEKHLRKEPLGSFKVGDTIALQMRIKEGDKERVQALVGTVIRMKRGHGKINSSFTVRRIVDGIGFERHFPTNSPTLVKAEVVRQGSVRRAKLYYLRDRVGKSTKTKELVVSHTTEAAAEAAKA